MSSTFNSQILVDKLARLNNSQQSIETLSHWCIFHRRNARQVVETWERRFHCSPQDQRVSFLYLANDILQNSRRKGLEFVTEFWKVLPGTLHDVLENGDDFGRSAVLRLINIWEERKVFISRGQSLKEEILETKLDNGAINEETFPGNDVKQPKRVGLQKIIASYEAVCEGSVDEDSMLDKCRTAITRAEKQKDHDGNIGQIQCVEKLEGCCEVLRESIDQLKVAESSRATLVLHLREALQEQELKLNEVRDQLQVAQSKFDETNAICERLLIPDTGMPLLNGRDKGSGSNIQISGEAVNYASKPAEDESAKNEQSAEPVTYGHQQSASVQRNVPAEEEKRRAEAAAMAEKLTASTSSAHVLSYVLSSLAQEGINRNQTSDPSSLDCHPLDKKPKLEDMPPSTHAKSTMVPLQAPLPLALHPDVLQQGVLPISLQNPLLPVSLVLQPPPSLTEAMPPLPPTLPPLQPPLPPSGQINQNVGPTPNIPNSYGLTTLTMPECPLANMHFPGVPRYPHPSSSFQNA